jgi:catechol 2,3-dioxygenase-like lactoylglutathione lyase family enzyme
MFEFNRTVPIFRMFDVRKAKEFYCGFLGFSLDWEHTFEPNTPVYMQVSRGKVALHLSEHYGDGVPGAAIRIEMTGIEDYLRELQRKKYKFYRPGIQLQPWNAKEMSVIDPFGNRIHFSEFVRPERPSASKSKRKPRAK